MAGKAQAIVLASGAFLPGSSLQTLLLEHHLELELLLVVTNSATLQATSVPKQTFQKAVSLADGEGHHTPAFLGLVASTLRSGASLTVYEPARGDGSQPAAAVKKALLLAGFVDSTDRGVVDTAQGQHICVSLECRLAWTHVHVWHHEVCTTPARLAGKCKQATICYWGKSLY